MDGVLLIDKPTGPTSFDVVRQVRRRYQQKKVGHAGTLDPLASGLLIVCLGQGTKLVPYLMDGGKQYEVTVTLGWETDTLDSQGEMVRQAEVPRYGKGDVEAVAKQFLGTIMQVPPLYSALKKDGEALYRKARRGEAIELAPRPVRIDDITVLSADSGAFSLAVACGKGTYIRSLARDMAVSLGTLGHVSALRRTRSSGFDVARAHPLEMLSDSDSDATGALLPLVGALPGFPRYELSDEEARAVGYGKPVPANDKTDSRFDEPIALVHRDILRAIAERTPDGCLKILRGFS